MPTINQLRVQSGTGKITFAANQGGTELGSSPAASSTSSTQFSFTVQNPAGGIALFDSVQQTGNNVVLALRNLTGGGNITITTSNGQIVISDGGVAGPQGPTGPQGIQGVTGPTGASGGGSSTATIMAANYINGQNIAATTDPLIPFAVDTGTDSNIVADVPSVEFIQGEQMVLQVISGNSEGAFIDLNEGGGYPVLHNDGSATTGGELRQYHYYTFTFTNSLETTGWLYAETVPPYYSATDSGSADAYVASSIQPAAFPALYTDLQIQIAITVQNNNTGGETPATLDIGFGPIDINGTSGVPNALIAWYTYLFRYNGDTFDFFQVYPTLQVQPGQVNFGNGSGCYGNGLSINSGFNNFIGSPGIVFGYNNTVTSTRNFQSGHFIAGGANTLTDCAYGTVMLGFENTVESSYYTLTVGGNNYINHAQDAVVVGWANRILPYTFANIALGQNNQLSGLYGLTIGNGNYASSSSPNLSIGRSNHMMNGPSMAIGGSNTVNSESFVFGYNNAASLDFSFLFGTGNYSTNGSGHNFLFGSNNVMHNTASYAFAFGASNAFYAGSALAFGSSNVLGTYNNLSMVVGNSNNINSSNSLTMGSFNESAVGAFIAVGSNNQLDTRDHSVVFGDSNTVNARALVFGDSNTLVANGNSGHNVVLGDDCVIGGQQVLSFGRQAADNSNWGPLFIQSAGSFGGSVGVATHGGMQHEQYILVATNVTGTDPAILTTDGSASPGAGNIANIPDKTSALFSIDLLAYDQTTNISLVWSLTNGLITRATGAASTSMGDGNPVFQAGPTSSGPPSVPLPTVDADTTNGGFALAWTPPVANADTWTIIARLTMLKTVAS